MTSLTLGFPKAAAAEDSSVPCSNPRVQVEEPIPAAWVDAVSRLCRSFGVDGSTARGSRLRLRTEGGEGLVVEATLADEHVAVRRVPSPDELDAVVEALTAVIPDEAAPETKKSEPEPPSVKPRPAPAPAREPPTRRAEEDRVHVELGVGLDGRLSGSPLYLSLGGDLYAGLRPGRWLVGVTARWQPAEVPASSPREGFELDSAGAGFIVLYRLWHAPIVDLDAGGSVLVLVDTQSIDTRSPDEVGSATEARFGALVRALFGKSAFRIAPSLDADIAPTRVRRSVYLKADLPPLPAWSVALGLGVSWVNL
jgi:hypothetical protein